MRRWVRCWRACSPRQGAREPLARRRRRDQAPCPDLRRHGPGRSAYPGRTVIGGPGASGGQWRLIRRLISLRGSAEHEPDRQATPTAPRMILSTMLSMRTKADKERLAVMAMAATGSCPHGESTTAVSPDDLPVDGMVYQPSHGPSQTTSRRRRRRGSRSRRWECREGRSGRRIPGR